MSVLFRQNSARRPARSRQPAVELLESRRLLSVGLHIALQKGPNLAADPVASAAADQAAALIESMFADPVTLVVDVELEALDLGTVAHSTAVIQQYDYDALRALLVADAAADEAIVTRLPTSGQLQISAPAGFTLAGAKATRANLLALGVPADILTGGPASEFSPGLARDMSIRINSLHAFDYNRSDGINAGQFDFVGELAHEIAHGMGFESELRKVDTLVAGGSTEGTFRLYPFDLFRLSPGAGAADFTHSPRLMQPGNVAPDQVFYDGGVYGVGGANPGDIPLSTGELLGDGRQSSHWKDDALSGVYIGALDPTTMAGSARVWTNADKRALSLIGWDELRPGSISGVVYEDSNGNGVQNAGESGLSGWQAYLDINANGLLDVGEPAAFTGAGGAFSFGNLAQGVYGLRVDVLDGWSGLAPNPPVIQIELFNGQTLGGYAFGMVHPGVISGNVYHDLNADGQRSSEKGLGGHTVYLDANANGLLDEGEISTFTGINGDWSIVNLGPGEYTMRVLLNEGWFATTSAARTVTLSSSTNAPGQVFGVCQYAGVSGKVFHDANGNGRRDVGEMGVAGQSVYLDLNNDGVQNGAEPLVVTDAAGKYRFSNVVPGTYGVRGVAAGGWLLTSTAPQLQAVTLTSGANAAGKRLGVAWPATVKGRVFNDFNSNGRRDAGETGVAGRNVLLDLNGNGRVDKGNASAVSSAAISAPAGQSAVSTLAIDGTFGLIRDINVGLQLQGGNVSAFLLSPAGQRIKLLDGAGSYSGVLDDEIQDSRPAESLTAFDNGTPAGFWRLEIHNNGGDPAQLLQWSLAVQYGDVNMRTSPTGRFEFKNVWPGTYTLRHKGPGYAVTNPAARPVTLVSASLLTAQKFGVRELLA